MFILVLFMTVAWIIYYALLHGIDNPKK